MSWVKLDDGFLDHPKFLHAGPVAGYLAVAAICWSNRNLTDGFIPSPQVSRLANLDGITDEIRGSENDYVDAGDLARALVGEGLWVRVDGGFQIHDYLDHQPSAEKIRERRRADLQRKNGTKGAAVPKGDPSGVVADTAESATNGTGSPLDADETPNGFRAESEVQELRSKKKSKDEPPYPPEGESPVALIAPVRPKGNRDRDLVRWQAEFSAWVGEHFPGCEPRAVERLVSWVPKGTDPTPTAVREIAESAPNFAHLLEPAA